MGDNKNIKEIIDTMLRQGNKFSRSYNEHTVEEVWRKTFGELISSYTTRVLYKDEILTVYITSSPLKEEIHMNKETIIRKMNENLVYRKVADIRIR